MLRANNDLCLHCTKAECNGICDALKEDMGEVNGRRYARTITWHGVTRTINEWAEVLGISRQTLYRKLGENTDISEIINIMSNKKAKETLPYGSIELTTIRLSTMPIDYDIYWKRIKNMDGSKGLISRYGTIQTSRTNRISNPTESKAMPEINMTDEELKRRAWIGCVLFVIDRYRSNGGGKKTEIMGDILEWRALDGMTLKKINERINEMNPLKEPVTLNKTRKIMSVIIEDIAREACKRGLIVEPQK